MSTPIFLPFLPANACRNGHFCPTPDYGAYAPQAPLSLPLPPDRFVCQNTKMYSPSLRTLDNTLRGAMALAGVKFKEPAILHTHCF